ncbi:hypothetical protein [Actinosynnema sp. NPDC020468]|uniref:hypothetical protein n=1 Tax=Actinosynnema sp. NPDC020468 TaxID=3154488 RepID=UPI0034087764
MPQVTAAVTGVFVLGVVALSVLRTLFCPRGVPARAAVWAAWAVARPAAVLARRVPGDGGRRVMDFAAPLGLCLMVLGWLGGLALGFVLLALGAAVVEARRSRLVLRSGWPGSLLAVALVVSTVLVLAAFVVYVVWHVAAHERRERLVTRFAAHTPDDAEGVLTCCLRDGSRTELDARFAEWAGWMSDVHRSHLCHPGLLYHRPNGALAWTTAAVVMMDAAALVDAVAPGWAPPHTRVLLDSGAACLQRLAALAGVAVPRTRISLQGREEHAFSDSLRVVVGCGMPVEREFDAAWAAFQDNRVRYAPHSVMLSNRLLLRPEDVVRR